MAAEETKALTRTNGHESAGGLDVQTMHALVVNQDMSKLSAGQQVQYYLSLCAATGLDPRTKPFAFISAQGKLIPYALKSATDQLRKANNLSVSIVSREIVNGLYLVETLVTDGRRQDTDIGAVAIEGLKGDALGNAMMKAITKAKRRATLSFCGLGMLDETEVETIPNARHVEMPAVEEAISATATRIPDDGLDSASNDDLKARLQRAWEKGQALGLGLAPLKGPAKRSEYVAWIRAAETRIAEAEAAIPTQEEEAEQGELVG